MAVKHAGAEEEEEEEEGVSGGADVDAEVGCEWSAVTAEEERCGMLRWNGMRTKQPNQR